MLSISPDRPLAPETLAILQAVQQATALDEVEPFVIGATARDILMQHVFGIAAGRATRDVDFAIAVRDWEQFENIKARLIVTGRFHLAAGISHRLYFEPAQYGEAYPLDLVPFGAVEHKPHEIAWPPDMHVVMNVAGYGEALQSALAVDVGGLVVRVVSLPGLTALKLLAWADRYLQSSKDALDLRFLMENYHQPATLTDYMTKPWMSLKRQDMTSLWQVLRCSVQILAACCHQPLSQTCLPFLKRPSCATNWSVT
jgi:predicted nucleotidyltransferase